MSEIDVHAAWWVGEAISDHTSSVMACTAGLGSGKTHGECQWHHHRVRDNVGARFSAFMEPTYHKVMDTAIPTYQKVLQSFGRAEGWHYKVVKSPFWKIIYLDQKPHHEVHFLSADRPDLIAGVEYSHASEDEAGVNHVQARRNLRTRLFRDRSVRIPQFLVAGAPQGITEFAEEFDSETLEGWNRDDPFDHYRIDEIEGLQVKKRRFILWTDHNPFVTPQYIAELMSTYGHNPNLIQSYRYGRFCPLTEGVAVRNYRPQIHDIDDIDADPFLPIALTWDFNANPLAWISLQRHTFHEPGRRVRRYVAIHEANQGASDLDEACIEFRVKHPVQVFRDTPIKLYGDRTGHHDSHKVKKTDYQAIRDYLLELGYRNIEICASQTVAPEAASIEAVNKAFDKDILNVCRRCVKTKKSIMATTWQKGVRKLEKPKGETWSHWLDGLKYYIYQERVEILGTGNIIYGKN